MTVGTGLRDISWDEYQWLRSQSHWTRCYPSASDTVLAERLVALRETLAECAEKLDPNDDVVAGMLADGPKVVALVERWLAYEGPNR